MSTDLRCYSIERAAELLGCSKRHVQNLCASKALPFVRLGRRVAVRHSDLAAYLERHCVGGSHDAQC